jgi:mycothiol synthase
MSTNLPGGVQVRAPRKEDQEAIVDLLVACDLSDCGKADSSLEVLQREWRNEHFNPEQDAWVALVDGRPVGYAALPYHRAPRIRFYGRVHPAYRGQGLGSHLLALVEKRAHDFVHLAMPDERVFLQTWCSDGSSSAKSLLEIHEYRCVRHTWVMGLTMEQPPAEPRWPEGIVLRPFVPERDGRAVFEAKEAAFRDHWGYLPGDFESWYQQNAAPRAGFDPSLWFIAMDGDEIAGIALCGYYMGEGEVEILGVRRPWRRSGLGLALLHHAFGEFYRRGQRKVGLGVDSESLTGATRLYERAGMSVELVYDDYVKDLRAGTDRSTQYLAE